jgi:hypothetical protein
MLTPQVHCIDKPEEFGVGNLGITGIAAYTRSLRPCALVA